MDERRFRSRLLAWFDEHARDLPWRRDPSPYETLVSEVMLQQTRVETVIPYYERWLARFPDLRALADAPEDDVLRAWEGLGYYSRARNLHGAARAVRERFAGELPSSYDALRELRGVGDYTAGAVASIAFGEAQPAVDGNVKRVLARLFDLEDPRPADVRARAAALVDPERPGDFNQALMELGATICTPRSPACDDCPVEPHCLARARGTVALRPAPRKRAAVPSFDLLTIVAIDERDRVLLRRRPPTGLLANLWEFPSIALDPASDAEDQARALLESLVAADVIGVAELPAVEHVFSHRRETYHPLRLDVRAAGSDAIPPCMWVEKKSLRAQPMPRAQRRIQKLALSTTAA